MMPEDRDTRDRRRQAKRDRQYAERDAEESREEMFARMRADARAADKAARGPTISSSLLVVFGALFNGIWFVVRALVRIIFTRTNMWIAAISGLGFWAAGPLGAVLAGCAALLSVHIKTLASKIGTLPKD